MNAPDAKTRRANRLLLTAMAFFAVFFVAAIILWKAFLT